MIGELLRCSNATKDVHRPDSLEVQLTVQENERSRWRRYRFAKRPRRSLQRARPILDACFAQVGVWHAWIRVLSVPEPITLIRRRKENPRVAILATLGFSSCGDRIRTCDLEVMSLASYRAAPPRVKGVGRWKALDAFLAASRPFYTNHGRRRGHSHGFPVQTSVQHATSRITGITCSPRRLVRVPRSDLGPPCRRTLNRLSACCPPPAACWPPPLSKRAWICLFLGTNLEYWYTSLSSSLVASSGGSRACWDLPFSSFSARRLPVFRPKLC